MIPQKVNQLDRMKNSVHIDECKKMLSINKTPSLWLAVN